MGLVLAEYIYGKEEKSTFGNNLAMKKESFWIHGNLCLSSVLMTFKIILLDYHFVLSTVDGKAAKQYCALLSQLEGQRLFVGSSPFKHFFLA